ncbi:hypothetical protein P2O46_24460, partial [Escherichia coli]
EWVHVQLHQQKGMISLSPPTICNSADTNKVNLSVKELSVCSGGSYTRVWRALKTLDNDLHLIAFDGGTIWFRPDMFETLRVGPDELVTARRRGNSVGGGHG